MKPKICVPLVGKTWVALEEEIALVQQQKPDFVEWRGDCLQDRSEILPFLFEISSKLQGYPLLFTWRTGKEGGKEISPSTYQTLLKNVIETGIASYIDLELFFDQKIVKNLVSLAHKNKVGVILSNHDFEQTPDREEILQRLLQMRELGADIGKIAVMPQCPKDVIQLLSVTEEFTSKYPDFPIITMSMGQLGMPSRVCGELTGSCVTFASLKEASAPGQIPIATLKQMVRVFSQ